MPLVKLIVPLLTIELVVPRVCPMTLMPVAFVELRQAEGEGHVL